MLKLLNMVILLCAQGGWREESRETAQNRAKERGWSDRHGKEDAVFLYYFLT